MYYKISRDYSEVLGHYTTTEGLIFRKESMDMKNLISLGLYIDVDENLVISNEFNLKCFIGGKGLQCIQIYNRDRKINEILKN